LYSQNWAIEYHAENGNIRVVVGVSGISESDARQRIADAGFSDCGVEFRIFDSQLVGAVFTRSHRVTVGPASEVLSRGISGQTNKGLLGGAVGGSDNPSSARRFALSVAHLFSEVGN